MTDSSRARAVVVLGSTGSIGTQALELIEANPDRFRVVGLAAGGGRPDLLARQALRTGAEVVGVSRASAAQDLQLALYATAQRAGYAEGQVRLPTIVTGPTAAAQVAAMTSDVVLNGITGSVGLGPTLAALDAGRTVALANKESLVAGGSLVAAALGRRAGDDLTATGRLVPVDSEHSAIAQCLRGGRRDELARLVLTASGGPFRGRTTQQLRGVTPNQALAHPTWDMGPVVTINSATLVNKGLELIEAHLLFGVPLAHIAVVVHPQSVVHSMVEFTDGATLAQASPPDMRLPIALGLSWPDRVAGAQRGLDWSRAASWTFEPLDDVTFPAVQLCREAADSGGTATAALNAANEEVVAAFLAGALAFTEMVKTVAAVVDEHLDDGGGRAPGTLADVLAAEDWARVRARELTGGLA